MKSLKEYVEKIYREAVGESVEIKIADIPKKRKEHGDLSIPSFNFAKTCYSEPPQAAKDLAEILEFDERVEKVEVVGPFVNIYANQKNLTQEILSEVLEQKENYGKINIGNDQLVVLDYSAPNIGKPLHVGHIRSTILGDSIIKILNFAGYKTHGINYLGDVGLHIGKILAAYELWGNEEKLKANPEEEILNLYIGFCKKEKEMEKSPDEEDEDKSDNPWSIEAKKRLERVEAKDPELLKKLKLIEESSFKAFDRVYGLLDVKFDEFTGQSQFSEKGKKIVREALERGLAEKTEDGAIVMSLKDYNLPQKVILRSDGTAIYSTQDLGAATFRKEHFDFHKLLYVVAVEQETYFKQLFSMLDKLGHRWSKDCFHVNFGMINLAEGKMSTREGAIVYLEEVLNKSVDMAKKIIEEKNPGLENKDQVAQIIGIGAIKYMVLGVDYSRPINFSWERALNFESSSAPYIQYSFARANSIMEKAGQQPQKFNPEHLQHPVEYDLVKKIGLFPLVVERAAENYKPNIIANYAQELSTLFNSFYKQVNVLNSGEGLESKLCLIKSFMTTSENAMKLLGIKMPEKM